MLTSTARPVRSSSARSPSSSRRWSRTSRARRTRRSRTTSDLLRAVDRLISHADSRRRLGVRANADNADDAARARGSAPRASACAAPSTCSWASAGAVEHIILADDGDGAADRPRQAAAAAACGLHRAASRPWTVCRSRSGCSTRPCTSSCPTAPISSVKVALAQAAATRRRGREAARGGRRLHEVNPMLGLRGVRLGLAVPGLFDHADPGDRGGGRRGCTGGARPAGRDHDPAGRLGGGALPGPPTRATRCWPRTSPTRGCPADDPDRHHDRAAARGADGRRSGGGRRVLLLRHQRPHPDDVGILPRRRRGGLLLALPRPRGLRWSRRSRASTSTASAGSSRSPSRRAGSRART